MDVAEIVDVGDVDAGGVAAPLRQLGTEVIRPIGKAFGAPTCSR